MRQIFNDGTPSEDIPNVSIQLRGGDLPESCPYCQRNCLTFQDHHLEENAMNQWIQGGPNIVEHKHNPFLL